MGLTRRVIATASLLVCLLVAGAAAGPDRYDQKARQKAVKTVASADGKALATAIVGAAQDAGFQVHSFSVEDGIVRLYEEHRLLTLVDKGYTFSYCSSSVRVRDYAVCTETTTAFKPTVLDDNGMVTTWRRVLFRPAGEEGHFDVLFEVSDATGIAFAGADKKEREQFLSRLDDRLGSMRQRSGGRFDAQSLKAAAGDTSSGPAGAYALESIGGEKVPTQAVTFGMVSESVYVLAADGTFKSSIRTNLGTQNAQGKYTVNGASVLFQANRGLETALLEGDTLTVAHGRLKWVYRRMR